MSGKQIQTQTLLLIRGIYIEENQIRDLSADERPAARKEKVAPEVAHLPTKGSVF